MWLLGWCVDGIVFGAQLRASNILSITNALLLEGWISRERLISSFATEKCAILPLVLCEEAC